MTFSHELELRLDGDGTTQEMDRISRSVSPYRIRGSAFAKAMADKSAFAQASNERFSKRLEPAADEMADK